MKKLFLTQRSISFSRLLSAVFLLLASVVYNTAAAQCSPDVEPPTMACAPVVVISANQDGPNMTLLPAAPLNNGTYDNCTALTFRIGTDLTATTPPNTTQVPIFGVGETFARLWAGDAAGNWNSCTVLIESNPPKCNPDVQAPSCTPPPNLTISLANYEAASIDLDNNVQMSAAFGAPAVWDNCSNDNVVVLQSYQLEINSNNQHSKITRSFMALDEAFNATVVAQEITIDGNNAQIHVPGWFYPGDATEDNLVAQSDNDVMMAQAYSDQVFDAACNGEKVRVKRTHTVIDWLFPSEPGDPALELPVVDLDGDGQTGDAYDVIFSNDSVWMVYNGQTLSNLGPKSGLYTYTQELRYNYLDTSVQSVYGFVYREENNNCLYDAAEPILANWKVKVTGNSGEVYTGYTDATGAYEIYICPGDTQLEISLDVPFNYNTICPTLYPMNLPAGASYSQNIPVMLVDTCPLLTVELATQRIRPCFPGKYSVSYCNLSDQAIPGTHVVVQLDSLLLFNSASIPHTSLGNQMYDFVLDTLVPGECGLFDVFFSTNCDAPVGLTHCSEARIFPDTVCGNANWSGAIIAAKGYCEGDKVRLVVENVGLGAMSNELNFVVVEDLIMYSTNPFKLDPGITKEVIMPANGATWRIETPQESGYPWHGKVAAFVEGCGGLTQTGMPLVFSVATPSPFVATDCTESVSSYDPNDKQAVPKGFGAEHFIEANTDIQYTIRFQNTGTDTAYTVILLDTLSPLLNPMSITRSTASHAYDLDVLPGNILRVRFDNIKLPHQAINEAGSQGFVKFNVAQTPDNPLGTVIENRAAIYFDNNAPVITNTTVHTIGKDFMFVSTTEPFANAIQVFPNPATSEATLALPVSVQGGHFTLTNALGKVARTTSFNGNTYRFERLALSSGVYYFTIRATDGTLYSGRIVLR